MAVTVTIKNLVKHYDTTRALDGVSLTIAPGELFFLLGPSGCGKTTLLRAIAGFVTLDSGELRFDGADMTALPTHKRDTGMVFQSYALWPHKTVAENVAFGLEMRHLSKTDIKKRVAEALEMVQMTRRAAHRPNQLSGGQQQRVALARALVIHPRCLLLDEPLSNLDAKLRLEMRTEIRRICKEAGITSIYVTHDQKEALSIADRMAIMKDGQIMQIGAPLDVYRRPNSAFTASFIGEINLMEATVTGIDGDTVTLSTALDCTRLHSIDCTRLHSTALELGTKITIGIRPEVIRFDTPPPRANRIEGTLSDTVYLGEVAQHRLHCGTVTLKAFEINPRHLHAAGDTALRAWIDPADIILL